MFSLHASLLLTTCFSAMSNAAMYSRVKAICASQAHCDENKTITENLLREK